MILKIGQTKIDFFNRFALDLKYNSIASSFSFDFYFDPELAAHRTLFRPGSYQTCTVEHEGELLITGRILHHSFTDQSEKQMASISGYSLPGVLQDCEIPTSLYPLQSDRLTLQQIADKLVKPFGIRIEVDPAVATRMNKPFKTSTADEKQSIQNYLTELATQLNINLSHTPQGALYFTNAKTKVIPIIDFDFNNPIPGVKFGMVFPGQQMHSQITIQKQANSDGGNAGEYTIQNPYGAGMFRPKVKSLSSGDDITIEDAAKNALADELSGIKFTIGMDRWAVDGKLIRPNNTITITNPDVFLYDKTQLFVEGIQFTGNESEESATLNCVLPESYNNSTPSNIFAS